MIDLTQAIDKVTFTRGALLPSEKIVLMLMMQRIGDKDYVDIAAHELATLAQMSTRTVQRAIANLKKKERIVVGRMTDAIGKIAPNRYRVPA